MARGKVELRRIDDRARRLVSFSKRRGGLLKKARELAVLCDADVGVIVFSPKGKLSHFPSHTSLEKTIQRYSRFLALERNVSNISPQQKAEREGCADQETDHAVPEVDESSLDDGSIEQLNVSELTKLEEKCESMLRKIRLRKTDLLMDLVREFREQEMTLVWENRQDVGVDVGEEEEPSCGDGNSGSSSSSTGGNGAPPRTLQLFVDI